MTITLDAIVLRAQSDNVTDNAGVLVPSIGVDAVAEIDITSDTALEAMDIWVVPKLFGDGATWIDTGVPTKGWRITLASVFGSPTTYTASLVGFGLNTLQRKNLTVSIDVDSDMEFSVNHNFHLLADTDLFIHEAQSHSNEKTLKRNHQQATTDFDNTFPSVYGQPKKYHCLIYLHNTTTGDYTYVEAMFDVEAGFFNKSENDSAPRLSNHEIILERNSQVVTNLSSYDDTLVTVKVQDPGVSIGVDWDIQNVGVWLLEKQIALSLVPWKQKFDGSYISVLTNLGGVATIDNKIKQPTTEATLSAGYYEGSFTVDSSLIDSTKEYLIYVIWGIYDAGDDFRFTETHKSDSISANGTPEAFELGFETDWKNLGQSLGTDILPTFTPAERGELTVTIDKDLYDYESYANGSPFIGFENDLFKIDIEIYDNASPTTILKTISIYKVGSTFVCSDPNFVNIDDLVTSGIYTVMLRMLYTSLDALNDNFIAKDMRIKHNIYFSYDLGFDTWYVKNVFEDKFTTNTGNPGGANKVIDWIKLYELSTGKPLKNFCEKCDVLVRVKLMNGKNASDYKFVAIVDKSPYGGKIGNDKNILEHEVWSEYIEMESDEPLYDVDEDFNATTLIATYKIPFTYFQDLTNYLIGGIAIKYIEGRITEDGILRITEESEQRIIE